MESITIRDLVNLLDKHNARNRFVIEQKTTFLFGFGDRLSYSIIKDGDMEAWVDIEYGYDPEPYPYLTKFLSDYLKPDMPISIHTFTIGKTLVTSYILQGD